MGICQSSEDAVKEWEAAKQAKHQVEAARQKAVSEEQQAEMRRDRLQSPPPMMMHGGVIRLTPDASGFFDWTPLAQHEEWLQDRITRAEWSALILSINDAGIARAIACESALPPAYRSANWKCEGRLGGARSEAYRIRADWLERGLDLLMPPATPARLYFKVVPVGSTPVNNAAGLGEMSAGAGAASAGPAASSMEGATGTGTVASPPAYPADNAPPGGLNAAVPAVASVYAFPIVVKPAPSHSTAGSDDGPVTLHLSALSAFRFCPLCGIAVDSASTRKPFCGQCGGKWR